jgi:putative addiction module component (TIGR02574 family)
MVSIIDRAKLKELSLQDRLALIDEIWMSLSDEERDFPLSESQKKELDRRVELYEQNPDRGVPWSEVKSRLLSESE